MQIFKNRLMSRWKYGEIRIVVVLIVNSLLILNNDPSATYKIKFEN
jgi:hypothetical protein